jgi:GntR family transcriptional regulator, rspAB operon transcriptional repressor
LETDFAPVRANLGQQVFNYLRDRIYKMDLQPGSRLGVGEIAEQLGVSRSPVRDAFHLLLAEGLIVPGPASGYRVIQFDRKYIEDVFVVRRALELVSVRLCTENLNRPRAEQLLSTWRELRADGEDSPSLLETHLFADAELHRTICELSGNVVLQDTLEKIITRAALIRRWVFTSGISYNFLMTLADEHLKVLEAVVAGDAEAAVTAMDRHLVQGQARALQRLDQH